MVASSRISCVVCSMVRMYIQFIIPRPGRKTGRREREDFNTEVTEGYEEHRENTPEAAATRGLGHCACRWKQLRRGRLRPVCPGWKLRGILRCVRRFFVLPRFPCCPVRTRAGAALAFRGESETRLTRSRD